MLTRCDSCGGEFEPRLIETMREDGGADQRLECPRCGMVYRIMSITARGLEIREELKSVPASDPRRADLGDELRREITDERGR